MHVSPNHRGLIACLLYGVLLFNALACSISHAQNSALQLSGLQGLFCSLDSQNQPGPSPATTANPGLACPLCSSGNLGPAALDHWLLQLPTWLPSLLSFDAIVWFLPVRLAWPQANPRAPPL